MNAVSEEHTLVRPVSKKAKEVFDYFGASSFTLDDYLRRHGGLIDDARAELDLEVRDGVLRVENRRYFRA